MIAAELLELSKDFERLHSEFEEKHSQFIVTICNKINEIAKSWSGSNLGYHSRVYHEGLRPPPSGSNFSPEMGLEDHWPLSGTTGRWQEFSDADIEYKIFGSTGRASFDQISLDAKQLADDLLRLRVKLEPILAVAQENGKDSFLEELVKKTKKCSIPNIDSLSRDLIGGGTKITRDMLALSQGNLLAPHQRYFVKVLSFNETARCAKTLSEITNQAGSYLSRKERKAVKSNLIGTNVFVGHGRSMVWRVLKDFIEDRLHLPVDEFNRVPVAGVTNIARLSEMLDSAAIAFVIMTAEDEMADGNQQARMNVVHEVGLFQGRLGFTRAIVLLEEGCAEFSNIQGLGQIRFPQNRIASCFEEVRQVLEREGLVEI